MSSIDSSHELFFLFSTSCFFLAYLLDPGQRGSKLLPKHFSDLQDLQEKVGKNFSIIWAQLLHYRAKSGVFSPSDIWEDAQLVDGVTWWKCHGTIAPNLQQLAITLLSIPTSSAVSERCWSVMGNIHSDSRNRLTDDKVEKLVYIYFNERMIMPKTK